MDIIEILKTNEHFNEIYFVIARTHFVEEEKGGVLSLKTDELNKYIEYVSGLSNIMPIISIIYDVKDIDYDPETQFAFRVNGSKISVIDKLKPRIIYYSRQMTGELNHNHIKEMKCITCEARSVKLIDYFDQSYTCEHCSAEGTIKCVYECTKCCTQYFYV